MKFLSSIKKERRKEGKKERKKERKKEISIAYSSEGIKGLFW